jgi:hypothetical protein
MQDENNSAGTEHPEQSTPPHRLRSRRGNPPLTTVVPRPAIAARTKKDRHRADALLIALYGAQQDKSRAVVGARGS